MEANQPRGLDQEEAAFSENPQLGLSLLEEGCLEISLQQRLVEGYSEPLQDFPQGLEPPLGCSEGLPSKELSQGLLLKVLLMSKNWRSSFKP